MLYFMDTHEIEKCFVSGLFISREKKTPREAIPCGDFRENFGLDGDAWSAPGDRQVIILTRKARLEVEADSRNGLCFQKFKETLQLDGISLDKLPKGTRLAVGEALMEISGNGKRCFPECEIVKSGSFCALNTGTAAARVLRSGKICVNDPVVLLKS